MCIISTRDAQGRSYRARLHINDFSMKHSPLPNVCQNYDTNLFGIQCLVSNIVVGERIHTTSTKKQLAHRGEAHVPKRSVRACPSRSKIDCSCAIRTQSSDNWWQAFTITSVEVSCINHI